MKNIKFIYLDVGGVALLDFSKTDKWDQLKDGLGINASLNDKFDRLFSKYEPEICTGKDLDEFVHAAERELRIVFPKNYSMLDDFVKRFEPNLSIQTLLQELSRKYKLGLLTNLYPGMLDAAVKRHLLPDVNWQAIIDSSVVGYRKPQKEIYKIAEQYAQTAPENILFVDNSQEHLQAAKSAGWHTLLYDPTNTEESNRKLKEVLGG